MNVEVNTTQISISLFEIPCSIFIIHYSFFPFYLPLFRQSGGQAVFTSREKQSILTLKFV